METIGGQQILSAPSHQVETVVLLRVSISKISFRDYSVSNIHVIDCINSFDLVLLSKQICEKDIKQT